VDVKLYARVAWRFKWVLLATFVIAVTAAVLSTRKVSFANGSLKLMPRGAQTWESSSVILVTQKGFPWGRSVFPILPAPSSRAITPTYADPSRFSGLALLYVQLANGNEFNQLLGPVHGTVQASPVLPSADSSTSEALPLIEFDSTAGTPAEAGTIADDAASAFQRYLAAKQSAAGIPVDQRVVVAPVRTHTPARLLTAPKKTVPLLIFLVIMAGGCGLALALENARPRFRLGGAPRDGLTTVGRDAAPADGKTARSA